MTPQELVRVAESLAGLGARLITANVERFELQRGHSVTLVLAVDEVVITFEGVPTFAVPPSYGNGRKRP